MPDSVRPGGQLVHVWPAARDDAPVVVAVHGITANGLSWGPVAERLAGAVRVLAPDLRGRGGSRDLPGPYGLTRHADDVAAILATQGVTRAVLAGHSMGAYVAALTAVRHPGLVSRVVMVDGGYSPGLPPGVSPDAVLTAMLGPAMTRLEAWFPSRAAYRAFWRAHPAFRFDWSPAVMAYLDHDLVGDGPYRSSCVSQAVRTDGVDMLVGPEATAAINRLPVPGVLLYADRGLLDRPPGAYDETATAGLAVPAVRVPGTNHYSILLAAEGAASVAGHLAPRPGD